MKHKSQKVGTEDIRYLDFEGNGRPLVFAHGIGKKPIAYERLLRELSRRGNRVIAPEMYGRNYFKRQPRSIAEYSDLTCDFMGSLKLEEPSLVGHSLGGVVSFQVASNDFSNAYKTVALSPGLPMNREGLTGVLRGALHYFSKRAKTPLKSATFFVLNTIPVDLHLLRDPIAWTRITNEIRALQTSQFQARVPSLIIQAENDELIELDSDVEERIKSNGVLIKRLDDLDHNWPISNYELASDEIQEFLN